LLVLGYGFKHGWDAAQEEIMRTGQMQTKNRIMIYGKHIGAGVFVAALVVVIASYFLGYISSKLSVTYLFTKFFNV
jgi:hypothetical protein